MIPRLQELLSSLIIIVKHGLGISSIHVLLDTMSCLNTCVHYAMFNSEPMSLAPQTFTIPCDADIPSLFFYNFEIHDAVSLLSACAMGH